MDRNGALEIDWLVKELKKRSDSVIGGKANEKRIAILSAAREALTDDGYANFTLRNVAKRAHIHLKTLQYYFETKDRLLDATLDYTLENFYFDSFLRIYRDMGDLGPLEAFTATIDYLFK